MNADERETVIVLNDGKRGMSLQDFLTGAESVRSLLKGGKR